MGNIIGCKSLQNL